MYVCVHVCLVNTQLPLVLRLYLIANMATCCSNKRSAEIKEFIENKRRRLNDANKALDEAQAKFNETKKLLLEDIDKAYDELGDDAEHLNFLQFLVEAEIDMIYILPKYMMKMLYIEPMDSKNTNIFQKYQVNTPCSDDVLQKILSFRDSYKTGLVDVEVCISGDAESGWLDMLDSVKLKGTIDGATPIKYKTAIEKGSVLFYTDEDHFIPDDEADFEYSPDDDAFYSITHDTAVVWMKRVSH